jgi:hypothetical protein
VSNQKTKGGQEHRKSAAGMGGTGTFGECVAGEAEVGGDALQGLVHNPASSITVTGTKRARVSDAEQLEASES